MLVFATQSMVFALYTPLHYFICVSTWFTFPLSRRALMIVCVVGRASRIPNRDASF